MESSTTCWWGPHRRSMIDRSELVSDLPVTECDSNAPINPDSILYLRQDFHHNPTFVPASGVLVDQILKWSQLAKMMCIGGKVLLILSIPLCQSQLPLGCLEKSKVSKSNFVPLQSLWLYPERTHTTFQLLSLLPTTRTGYQILSLKYKGNGCMVNVKFVLSCP